MLIINNSDLIHKFQILKVLTAIVDNPPLSKDIYFKGGTCASLAGYLDRFSVDLDFDLKGGTDTAKLRAGLKKTFKDLDLKIENQNNKTLFFNLKYQAPANQRNTLKFSVFEDIVKANDYQPTFLAEIDRLVNCQTIETMFANKLVAPIDRYKKHKAIAGRDIYDIHYFFSKNYHFKEEVIWERTKLDTKSYIKILIDFIDKKVTEKILTQDLNTLLPYEKFKKIRKTLKPETLLYLRSFVSTS